MKTVCVYHSIDLDGWMSAAIVKHWFNKEAENLQEQEAMNNCGSYAANPNGSIDFIGYNYGMSIPDLSEYDRVVLVDISFPKEEMLAINLRLGEKLIWIDHHQRTVNEVNSHIVENGVPMEGLVTGDGELKAACELTWEYFFSESPMPEIVRLLGRYDCFGHKGTIEEQKVLEFQYGARQCISGYNEAYIELVDNMFCENTEITIWEKGKSIYDYLCVEAKQVYKNGFEIKLFEPQATISDNGVFDSVVRKFICINKERFNPINFGIDYHKDGYDGCACFYRTALGKWSFSLYNDDGRVDCSSIAKEYGGGGHKGASGFIVDDINLIVKW